MLGMRLSIEDLNDVVSGCIYGIYHDEMNLLIMKYGIRYSILIYGIWGYTLMDGELNRKFGNLDIVEELGDLLWNIELPI